MPVNICSNERFFCTIDFVWYIHICTCLGNACAFVYWINGTFWAGKPMFLLLSNLCSHTFLFVTHPHFLFTYSVFPEKLNYKYKGLTGRNAVCMYLETQTTTDFRSALAVFWLQQDFFYPNHCLICVK